MRMVSNFADKIFSSMSSVKFDTLILIVWGSFAGIFLTSLLLCAFNKNARAASKRPFLYLINAYAAVTLSAFLTARPLAQSVLSAALFWCVAYILYGSLCLFRKKDKRESFQPALSAMPSLPPKPVYTSLPAAKSSVRLEHAVSVTDKLLNKNLGRSDRQELEKLKGTLALLQLKDELTPQEADLLNENFNSLLKLMAKYNV